MAEVRLTQDRHDDGWMEMAERDASPRLSGYVRGYVGYREDSLTAVRRTEIPTGDVSVIISFGPSIQLLDPDEIDTVRAKLTSFVAAIGTAPAYTEYRGARFGVELTMTPLGAGMVFGVPMGEFTAQTMDLVDVLGPSADHLAERLAEAPDWAARFALLDTELHARLSAARAPSPVAMAAWRRLTDTDGRLPIADLVSEIGCSHRHLLATVRQNTGVSPKELARLLRVRAAIARLAAGHPFATVAYDCGFSDQAHLNRDLRRITGSTPSGWAAGHGVLSQAGLRRSCQPD